MTFVTIAPKSCQHRFVISTCAHRSRHAYNALNAMLSMK